MNWHIHSITWFWNSQWGEIWSLTGNQSEKCDNIQQEKGKWFCHPQKLDFVELQVIIVICWLVALISIFMLSLWKSCVFKTQLLAATLCKTLCVVFCCINLHLNKRLFSSNWKLIFSVPVIKQTKFLLFKGEVKLQDCKSEMMQLLQLMNCVQDVHIPEHSCDFLKSASRHP